MAVVADTSFLIDLGRGNVGALDLLDRFREDHELVLVPSMVVAEYLAGSKDPDGDLDKLRNATELLPFTIPDAVEAGRLARETFDEGRFPGWMDALIAGFAARGGGLPIVTGNPRHFPSTETVTYG